MANTIIRSDFISAVIGYGLERGFAGVTGSNLPRAVGVLAEVDNGANLDLFRFTNSTEVGQRFGYGKPAHLISRIIRNRNADRMGSIPTYIIPVEADSSATAAEVEITVTGTPTETVTHTLIINGRTEIDGRTYSFTVNTGDTVTEIAQSIVTTITAALSCPVSASNTAGVVTATTKWSGASASNVNIEVDVGNNAAGVTYTVGSPSGGTGTSSYVTPLASIDAMWITDIIVSDIDQITGVQAWSGNPNNKTGRYQPSVFRPATFFAGTTLDTLSALTTEFDSLRDETFLCHAPAPGSDCFPFEAAANMAALYVPGSQSDPIYDPIGESYPDLPIPRDRDIGIFADADGRDQVVKIGSSTVELVGNSYRVVDLVTTYHPTDEPPEAISYRYVRDLAGIDWNIKFRVELLQRIFVFGKTIINDGKSTTKRNTISPSGWGGELYNLANDLELEGLIADAQFMKDSVEVEIASNPQRLDTNFDYQRTGVARILSTQAENNPNLGTLI